MIILLSHERFKRSREEADPQWLERANRRGVIDTLVRAKLGYWELIRWLDARRKYHGRPFLRLGEAASYFRGIDRTAETVARYFARKGPEAFR